jgi:glycosyltransferase involved in cell wall biosynthesis
LIYGGVFDSRVDFDFDRNKCVFGRDKDTIDLCFVAYRYTQDMGQKGYDQFVEVARLLAPADPRLRFHVVGDYSPDDLPLGDTAVRFTFHGSQPSSFFATFYPRMDVILSANRPVGELAGVFDGFPTGACIEAGFRGVLNCISDPLSLNVAFEDRRDILLIDRVAQRTATLLAALFAEPQRLYALAHANWRRFREVFDVDQQLWQRTRMIAAELLQQEMLIARPAAPPSSLNASAITAARAQAAYSEGRYDALLAEYRKLASGLAEATTYWEQRHDALLAEYRKLESGFAVAKMHWEQQQDAAQMAGDIISGREQPDAPAGPLGIRVLLGMLAKRLVPAVTLRLRRGRPGWLGL